MSQLKSRQETALVFGVSGQDGFFLSRRLLQQGFKVIGISRRVGHGAERSFLRHPNFCGIQMDLTRTEDVGPLLNEFKPGFIFNLAGFSHVGQSWRSRSESELINREFPKKLVQALTKLEKVIGRPRLLQASTSEIFGAALDKPQDESSPLNPVTPYGLDKADAHRHIVHATNAGDIDAVCAILYNHESHLRPESFVTRKMSIGAARIKLGLQTVIEVGSLSQERDWGFAGDHVEAVLAAALSGTATHYVIGTGTLHSVKELAKVALNSAGLSSWRQFLLEQDSLVRAREPANLVADSSLARRELGWYPKKSFQQTILEMVKYDLERLSRQE